MNRALAVADPLLSSLLNSKFCSGGKKRISRSSFVRARRRERDERMENVSAKKIQIIKWEKHSKKSGSRVEWLVCFKQIKSHNKKIQIDLFTSPLRSRLRLILLNANEKLCARAVRADGSSFSAEPRDVKFGGKPAHQFPNRIVKANETGCDICCARDANEIVWRE